MAARELSCRAARQLAQDHHFSRPVEITILFADGERLTFAVPEHAIEPAAPKFYSDLEQRIIDAMPNGEWISSAELAEKLGQLSAGGSVSSHFRAVLTNLTDRGAITSDRAGYRLARPTYA